jgi:hypothetical protein
MKNYVCAIFCASACLLANSGDLFAGKKNKKDPKDSTVYVMGALTASEKEYASYLESLKSEVSKEQLEKKKREIEKKWNIIHAKEALENLSTVRISDLENALKKALKSKVPVSSLEYGPASKS